MLSSDELQKLVASSPYHTFFKERLYIYDTKTKNIVGYMLKENYDEKTSFKKKDTEAAEVFASIEMQFRDKEEEKIFDYDAFVDTVIAELEIWLSYSSELDDE